MNLYNLTTFLKFYYFLKQVSPLWTWPCSIAKIGSNKMFKQAKNKHIITILVSGSAEEVPALVISLRSLCCRSISEQSRRHSILQSRRSRQWIFIPYPFRTNTNAGLSLSPISVLSLTSPSLHQTPTRVPWSHTHSLLWLTDLRRVSVKRFQGGKQTSIRAGILDSISPSTHACRRRSCWWQIDTVSRCRLMAAMIVGNCRIEGISRLLYHTWPWLAEQAIM